MRLTLIVAYASNGVIGRGDALPWRLPADLAHFKRVTMGCPIVMGRRTWDSIGRPLPGRRNLVVTRNAAWSAPGAEARSSLEDAIAACSGAADVFVIGGAQLYAQALGRADRVVATEIAETYDGDATFPALDAAEWRIASREAHPAGADTPAYAFVEYERRGERADPL